MIGKDASRWSMSAVRSRTRFREMSMRSQLAAIALLWVMLWVGMVAIHKAFTNEYYRMEQTRLQTIAYTAAYAGARLLPSNPYAARRAAHAYAEMNGIPASDIVLVDVADDQRSLTVKLIFKIPLGFALFEWRIGEYLTVTARADLPRATPIPQQLHPVRTPMCPPQKLSGGLKRARLRPI